MLEPRILRCTVCGLTHEDHSDDALITCEACGNQYLAADGIFLSQKTQKEIDTLANLRVRLSEMIKVNDAKMILSHAQDILKILPEDFLGSYFYAYGAYETRQPKFIYQFFKQSTFDTTPSHMRQVTAHMASYIDIKEYPLILNFIQAFDKDYISEAKKILKKRIQLEDQYSVIQRDVFICHRSTEYDTVLEVVRALEEDGFTCWYSECNLRPDDNENYWKNIEEAIDHSTLFLMISSQSAMLSKDVQRELQYANKQHKKKLEYKIDDSVHTTLFKHAFDGLKWIDASKELQLHQLKQRVYAMLQDGIETTPTKKETSSEIELLAKKVDIEKKPEKRNKNKLVIISLLILSIIIGSFIFNILSTDSLRYSQVALGYNHSILLSENGDVYTSGDNDKGQLGIGTIGTGNTNLNYVDIPLNTGEYIIDIEAGWNFSTILTNEGRIFTWGDNSTMMLGIGDNQLYVDSPIDATVYFQYLMNPNEKIITISSGAFSSIALSDQNRVITWGNNYAYGVINTVVIDGITNYTNDDVYFPVDVTPTFNLGFNEEVIKIYAKGTYFGLLTNKGTLYFWGQDPNNESFLGSSTNSIYSKPIEILTPKEQYLDEDEIITDFSIGDSFAIIVTNKNRILTFGQNYANQLGVFLPSITKTFTPIDVSNQFNLNSNESISNIFLGYDFGYIITNENRIIVWGNNYFNSIYLDDNNKADSPLELNLNDKSISEMSFNPIDNYFALITDDNELYMWGNNSITFNGIILKNTIQKIS